MNSNETLSIKGNLNIVLTDAQGKIKDTRDIHNKITGAGLEHILARLGTSGGGATYINYMTLGTTTDTLAEDGTRTALKAEPASGLTRMATTITFDNASATSKTIQYVADFAAGNPTTASAITEAGLFSQLAIGGTMLARTVFPVINKGTGDSMRITWKITLTAP